MDKKATLQELLTAFAAKAGLPRRRAEAFVRTFFDVIADALAREKFVRVKGLGTFKLVAVSERESVDVNTGERIQISGHTKVSFTPETSLRDLVNRPFAHFQTVVINEGTDLEALEAVDTPEITESSDALADEPETADDNDIPADEPKPAEPEAADSGTTEAEKTETDDEAEQPAFIPPSAVDYFAEYPLDDTDNDDTPATNAADAPATDNETSDKADEAPVTDDATGDSDTGPTQEAPQTSAAANTLPKWEEAPADETGLPDKTQPATTGAAPARPESELTEPGEAAGKHTPAPGATPAEPSDLIQPQGGTAGHGETTAPDHRQDESPRTPDDSQTRPANAEPTPPAQLSATQPPATRDVNWWKVTVVVIGILFLMMLSYFAGYFRLFCPCERLDALHRLWTEQAAPPAPAAPATPVPADTLRPATAPRDTAALPADTVAPTPPAPAATSPAASGAQPTARPAPQEKQPQTDTQTRKKNTQATTQRRKRTAPRHQKYIITGTRDTYVVSQGETLRTIAEHVYGSRGYAHYIIEYNHITHPDDIPAGLTIRLPELEPNPDYRPR